MSHPMGAPARGIINDGEYSISTFYLRLVARVHERDNALAGRTRSSDDTSIQESIFRAQNYTNCS